ncbi:MAG: hypothetical protein HRT77_10675 [Halioglobus sp.]|nr:hypothetical protein [Halioglobus sp.]
MAIVVLGLLLFANVHFIPSFAPSIKSSTAAKLVEGGQKSVFTLLLFAAMTLMVIRWRNPETPSNYAPSTHLHRFAISLLVIAFWVMTASNTKSRIRRVIEHSQLAGVALWRISHLLLNGDSRALVFWVACHFGLSSKSSPSAGGKDQESMRPLRVEKQR